MADGGLLLSVRDDPKMGWDIGYLAPPAPGRERTLSHALSGGGDQLPGPLSADGRWVLYTTGDGSGGKGDAFVARFPGFAGRRQISTSGADFLRWGRDGKEIIYTDRTKLMAAPVRRVGDALELGEPKALFEMKYDCAIAFAAGCFDQLPDGRFVVLEPTGGTPPLELVQNWKAGLKK
jgi:hypothetical protein